MLVAFAPEGLIATDRILIPSLFVLGRSSSCDLTIRDSQISKQHFRIVHSKDGTTIEDLQSTNGTYVDGWRIEGRRALNDNAVVRVGQLVLVFKTDGGPLLESPNSSTFGMAGRFHTSSLIAELREAALSARHILLAGPSGSGKELAAGALASMMSEGKESAPFVSHNAGLFATEDEATTTLFGLGSKVFSNVDARAGLVEQANGGALFLDETCNLPVRIQKSLLRVVEDGKTKRIGETQFRHADVRFIFASNKDDASCGLASDLFARLRVVRIPSLGERVADVPSIFQKVLSASLENRGIGPSSLLPLMEGDHFEALCLDGFVNDNIRGLIDISDRLTTAISLGRPPADALMSVFTERFKGGPVAKRAAEDCGEESRADENHARSHYEKHKAAIITVFREQRGNISATERVLREKGIRCSRRWLTEFVERWGLK